MEHDCQHIETILKHCEEISATKILAETTQKDVSEIKETIKDFLNSRRTIALSLIGIVAGIIVAAYSFAIDYGSLQTRTQTLERYHNISR